MLTGGVDVVVEADVTPSSTVQMSYIKTQYSIHNLEFKTHVSDCRHQNHKESITSLYSAPIPVCVVAIPVDVEDVNVSSNVGDVVRVAVAVTDVDLSADVDSRAINRHISMPLAKHYINAQTLQRPRIRFLISARRGPYRPKQSGLAYHQLLSV